MTKKLEEEFNLPPIEEVTNTDEEVVPTVEETQEVIEEVQGALSVSEKINLAFKEVKGLESHEVEMNDIAKKAIESYEQLMSLGMNVSDMAAGKVFAEASNMLKIALDASDAKTKAKLQQIDLMLKKARIDKFDNKGTETEAVQATVFDRNDLLKIIKGES
jgi:di/tripeptidase